ncbi:MAG: serine/threonine protein kinase [Acidobacteria bacterium]|nr:serine/threonine protein kinase [Acidobacteriota bacterium]
MSATMPGASKAALPPAILAQRYRLERRLAQGGMAEVWVATDMLLSRNVAVKLLKPNLAADPVVAERFRREAIAVAQLSHPNIVAVHDTIEETIGGERRQAVVMQLINGKSLRQLLDEQKRLSPDLTMHIGSAVAAALDCAHRANLVHRDVKPGNILITADGRVLLTDFGIAKGLTGSADEDLTSPNVMMGTAKYLSPEQVRGKKLDGRADLYSLGLVLYECLAGRVPFLGETDTDTALARLNREATDLRSLRPTLPDGLAQLIHRLLARKPDDRYVSGDAVRSELQRIAALPKVDHDRSRDVSRSNPRDLTPGRPISPPVRADRTPTSAVRPRQQPNRRYENRTGPSSVVVAGLLIAALVVGGALWFTLGKGSQPGAGANTTIVPVTSVGPVPTVITGPAAIAGVRSFDPDGDGTENDEMLPLLTDGDPNTAWHTVCYEDRYLGGKGGVGVVADLGADHSGVFTASIASAPYQVRIYAVPSGTEPTTFDGWGTPMQKFAGTEPGDVSVQFTTPVRYVLVSFLELGTGNNCSNNPYRGSIRELSVV